MTGQTRSHFAPVGPAASKSRRVADHILDLVRLGILEVGARLPSERELTELLGVSRTVVREALSALQLSGIVERRAGDGTYVRSTGAALGASSVRPILDDIEASTSLMQVLDAREALDHGVARLAIENADNESLGKLDEVLHQMEEALKKTVYDKYINLTLDFHEVLAQAAGNPYLEEVVKSLVGITRQYVWVLERNYNALVGQRSLEIHQSIANAIRARDQEALTRAVQRHYEEYPTLGNVRDRT